MHRILEYLLSRDHSCLLIGQYPQETIIDDCESLSFPEYPVDNLKYFEVL
jgi:hypothetical protein